MGCIIPYRKSPGFFSLLKWQIGKEIKIGKASPASSDFSRCTTQSIVREKHAGNVCFENVSFNIYQTNMS